MHFKGLLIAVATTALAQLALVEEATACGGCFVQQSENTQVSGHRMVLSVSLEQTTLWDQITYSGSPESFAWVLPTKGQVDVALSSDALFEALEQGTQVTVTSPTIQCPPPPDCGGANGDSFAGGGGSGGGSGGVNVIAQEVVGPYETVQLESTDPQALQSWLADHGYQIPADVAPIIDSYVLEGFNFLALRLVPGQGVDSMRPVRITTPGASPVLPLRMVAAGTGAVTPISLWIFGEGRYAPVNLPSFEIDPSELVWDWDTSSSNYAALRDAGFAATNGEGWLIEVAQQGYPWTIDDLLWLADYDPLSSGYGDENGVGAADEAQADVDALLGTLDTGSVWVTRMYAELARSALANDLDVGASPDQSPISGYVEVTNTVGTAPECPAVQPCGEPSDPFDPDGFLGFGNAAEGDPLGSSSCNIDRRPRVPADIALLGLALFGLAAWRRRRG